MSDLASSDRRAFLTATAAAETTAADAPVPGGTPPAPPAPGGAPARPADGTEAARHADRELRELLEEVDPGRIEDTVRRLAAFGTRHTLSSQTDPEHGIGAARDWVHARMKECARASGGRMSVRLQSWIQEPDSLVPTPTRITNVLTTLRGTSAPNRVYVVSGHYDSRACGAAAADGDGPRVDDDASGVAVVMELARVLAVRRTAATVVLAAVAGEAHGLYGASHLAGELKAAGMDVQGVFAVDAVGGGAAGEAGAAEAGGAAGDGARARRAVRLYAQGAPTGGKDDSPSCRLARSVRDAAGDTAEVDVRVVHGDDRDRWAGDHVPFLERGWPAVRFAEPGGNARRPCDVDHTARVARVTAAALWTLAQAPGAPAGVQVRTDELGASAELRWRRGTESGLAGYEVVWRGAAEPEWTHVVEAGDTVQHTVGLSGDDVFFGVRAVGRNGLRSPVALPARPR
ncbi:M28 family peptidase [Streptomyces thermolineatus]|uniref:M28 family peptidase n=1 Tax=Streptomyces thermolineatus TaxID=44033 RepID=UPI0031E1CBDF